MSEAGYPNAAAMASAGAHVLVHAHDDGVRVILPPKMTTLCRHQWKAFDLAIREVHVVSGAHCPQTPKT